MSVVPSVPRKRECAKQRLMRELKDLRENPIPNCNAAPLEENIFEWHANLTSPHFAGTCFHFTIHFPIQYPKEAPKVRPCSTIYHKNVFGDYICLDILTMSKETEKTPFRGWTSAYTVSSLLVQLQCFLFDVHLTSAPSSWKNRADEYARIGMHNQALNFTCKSCGHSGKKPFPRLKCYSAGCIQIAKKAAIPGEYKALNKSSLLEEDLTTAVHRFYRNDHIVVEAIEQFDDREWGKVQKIKQTLRNVPSGLDFSSLWVDISDFKRMKTPKPKDAKKEVQSNAEVKVVKQDGIVESYWLNEFFGVILDIIIEMVDSTTLAKLALVHEDFKKKLDECKAMALKNYKCFYTLKDLHDDTTILGFGVRCEVMGKRSRHSRVKKDKLQRLHPSFDIMSADAFDMHDVRTNIWKDCAFDAFLPCYLNKAHGQKAIQKAEDCIRRIWFKEQSSGSEGARLSAKEIRDRVTLTPERILETFSKVMNTTVVNMNKCVEDLEVAEIQLFDSIKAIRGYMAFHHMLLAFALRYPKIQEVANQKLKNFIEDKACRDKEITPDLGELIVALSVCTDFTWKDFIPAFLEEVLDRNVRWVVAKYPNLLHMEERNLRCCLRLTQFFKATRTGKRLAAFQCFFFSHIACPASLADSPNRIQILFQEYNSRMGQPRSGMAEELQIHSRKVLAMKDWMEYFNLVGFAAPTAIELCDWLRSSLERSKLKKYHSARQTLKNKEHFIEEPDFKKHMDPYNCCCAGGTIYSLKNAKCAKDCKLVRDSRTQLDIAFLIDCTGSMYHWLESAKRSMLAVIQDVTKRTSVEVVRFSLVAYRDYPGVDGIGGGFSSDDKYCTKIFEFTSEKEEIQEYVNALKIGGGLGGAAALTTAFHDAANLSWNKEAMKIIVHVGDEPCHGAYGSGRPNWDAFPEGCPQGHDPFKIFNVLAKQGVRIYNVLCGTNRNGLTKCFYHAMSEMTHGQTIMMNDAKSLPNVIFAAAVEEETMHRITQHINESDMLTAVKARHAHAREDQLIYEIYVRLKTSNFTVECSMAERSVPKFAQKCVETVMYCTDLAQLRALQNKAGERFYYTETRAGICTKQKQIVSEGQVRRWWKVNAAKAEFEMFQKHGCCYAQRKWGKKAALCRRKNDKLAKFPNHESFPWEKPNKDEVLSMFKRAGDMAKANKKSTRKNDVNKGKFVLASFGSKISPAKSETATSAWSKRSQSSTCSEETKTLPPTSASRSISADQKKAPAISWANLTAKSTQRKKQIRNVEKQGPSFQSAHSSRSSRSVSSQRPRGKPTQSIRSSRSTSSQRPRGAPIQSIRSSRSTSNQSVQEGLSQENSNYSRSNSVASTGPVAEIFQTSSPVKAVKQSTPVTLVFKIDTEAIVKNFIIEGFKSAGLAPPTVSDYKKGGNMKLTFQNVSDRKNALEKMKAAKLRVGSSEPPARI